MVVGNCCLSVSIATRCFMHQYRAVWPHARHLFIRTTLIVRPGYLWATALSAARICYFGSPLSPSSLPVYALNVSISDRFLFCQARMIHASLDPSHPSLFRCLQCRAQLRSTKQICKLHWFNWCMPGWADYFTTVSLLNWILLCATSIEHVSP